MMRTIPLSDLHRTAARRPAGYVERVLSHAEPGTITDTHYGIIQENWDMLCDEYRGTTSSIRPAQRRQAFAKPMTLEERGRQLWEQLHTPYLRADPSAWNPSAERINLTVFTLNVPWGDCRAH